MRADVLDGLIAHNRRFIPAAHRTALSVAARDADGLVVGGLVGDTTWADTGDGWLHVELLWVAEAARRGCRHAYLDTFAFQARPFYERCGYVVFAEQEGFPPGSRRYWLRKRIGDAPAG